MGLLQQQTLLTSEPSLMLSFVIEFRMSGKEILFNKEINKEILFINIKFLYDVIHIG